MISPYGRGETAADAAKVATAAVSTGASAAASLAAISAGTATGASAVVGSLMSAAGVSAVAAPPWSWVVAGGLALAAGTIQLVSALRRGKLRKADAVAEAQRLGIPDAATVPAFVVRCLEDYQTDPRRLYWTGYRVQSQLDRKKRGVLGFAWLRSRYKLEAKLRIIGALIALEKASARKQEPPAAPAATLQAEYGGVSDWVAPVAIVGVVVGVVAVVKARQP